MNKIARVQVCDELIDDFIKNKDLISVQYIDRGSHLYDFYIVIWKEKK